MKNTLFIIAAPLGDMICFSSYLKDYKETYPDENLYIKVLIENLSELFKDNVYVTLYDPNVSYNKIYEYNLYHIDQTSLSTEYCKLIHQDQGSIQHKHYFYLNTLYNLNVKHNTLYPIIQVNANKKIVSDKPICIINSSAGYLNFDSRFWGIHNYQFVIDKLKDKINFISVGSNSYNQLIYLNKLNNLYLDLINKTSIYEMLNIIAQADFVLTHESGLYHAGCIPSNKHKHVIVPAGSRHTFKSNYWESPNVTIHWLSNKDKNNYYKHCFNENEHLCMCGCTLSKLQYNSFEHNAVGANCKLPVFSNGEILSHCLHDINPQTVVNLFNDILKG